ncbi:NmrA/HSCARG family protein [Actinomadura luteofluorescens]
MSSSDAVLVIGATGNQGGATARQLLARGRRVHALVRDPGSPAARGLRDGGAVLVQGDLDDAESLRKAMNGVRAVFSVQALAYEPRTLAAEVRQGKTVADIAKESGVAHLVYSSVGGAERDTGLGMPATILRPVFFMNNLLHYADARDERVLSLPVRPDKPMQFIAADDIGVFAADAFDDPERSIGRQIELAGDELTFPEVARIYERVTGTPTRFEPLPIEERMFQWFAEAGYQADIPALRRQHPDLLTFERFLTRRLASARP